MNTRVIAALVLMVLGVLIIWFFLMEWVFKAIGVAFAVLCLWAGFRLLFRPSIGPYDADASPATPANNEEAITNPQAKARP